MQRLNLRDPELRKLIEETENFQGPEEETIDLEELRQYEDYDLNQVRAEMRRLNMEIDSHTQLTPIEVRKLIMKNEILFKKIEKVEDCVHDARLVKNLSLIVQNNMSKVSTNAITFRHEDFSKKIIEMLAQHKKEGDGPGMNKEMLIKLGLQAKKFIMKSPSLKVMKGALRSKEEFENKPPPKERKVRQKARTRDCDLVATQATILQETETTDAQSDRKVVNLFKIVVEIYKSCKGPINYFQLVIDPNSFATTVQNIFHISYLVKEGKVSIKLEDKIPYITPLKQKHKGGDSADNNQIVMNINMALWERMSALLKDAKLKPLLTKMESGESEEDDFKLVKRKIVATDKLLKHIEKMEGKTVELNSEILMKDKKIEDLKAELEELRKTHEEKCNKLKSIESGKKEQSNNYRQLETEVARAKCELLNSKVESNTLKSKIDELLVEKESLEDKIKNNVEIKRLKETYENEKWKNLADISNLTQQNEALKVRFEQQELEVKKSTIDVKEFEKMKKENCELKKELDENKKDRAINALRRKLTRAEAQIRKLFQQINNDQDYIFASDTVEENITLDEILESALQPVEQNRFPILMLRKERQKIKKKVPFQKLSDLSYFDPPNVYFHKPSISFYDHKQSDTSDEFRMLGHDDVQYLEDIIESVKRKRQASVQPKTSFSQSTRGRKRLKGNHIPNLHVLSSIKVMSPDRINSMNMQADNNISSMDTDSDPDVSEDSKCIPTIHSTTSLTAPAHSETNFGSEAVLNRQVYNKPVVKPRQISHPALASRVEHRQVEENHDSVYLNPNPSKVRKSHGMLQSIPMVKKTTYETALDKEVSTSQEKKVDANGTNLKKLAKTAGSKSPRKPFQNTETEKITVPAGVSQARAKILSQGVQIETPMSVGQKLTEAQKAEVRKRMVGRAPPSVTNRPSVNGFRSSEPVVKSASQITTNITSTNSAEVVNRSKPKASYDEEGIPERRKTQPAKIRFQPRSLNSKSTEVLNPNLSKGGENTTQKDDKPCDKNKQKGSISNTESQKEEKSKVENLTNQLGLSDSGSSDDDFDPEALLKQKQSITNTKSGTKDDINNDITTPARHNRSRIIDSDDEDNNHITINDVSFSSVDKNRSALDSDSSSESDVDVEKLLAQKTAMAFVEKSSLSSSDSETMSKEDDNKTKKRKAFVEIANKVKKRKEMEKEKELFFNNSSDKSVNGYSASELEKIRSSLDEDLDLTESEEETEVKVPKVKEDYSEGKVIKIAEMSSNEHSISSKSPSNEASGKCKNKEILISEIQEDSPQKRHIDSQPTQHKTNSLPKLPSNSEDSPNLPENSTEPVISSNSLPLSDKTPEIRKDISRPKLYKRESHSDDKKQTFKDQRSFDNQLRMFNRQNKLEEYNEGFLDRFNRNVRKLYRIRSKLEDMRKTDEFPAFKALVIENVTRVLSNISESGLNDVCDSFIKSEMVADRKEEILCDHLYSILMKEDKKVALLCDSNPDAPPVTRTQHRIFTFLTVISDKPGYGNMMDKMTQLLYCCFFGDGRMYNMSMSNILSIARVLVLCARHTDNLTLMRKFLFDLFYFKNARNHLVVGVITDLWPEVFDHKDQPLFPVQEAILWSIFHTGDTKSTSEMKVFLVRSQLEERHGYSRTTFDAKLLVDKYINQLPAMSKNPEYLLSVKQAFLLLGRGFDYKWSNNNIMNKLFKCINTSYTNPETKDENLLRWTLETIGLISRLYTQEGRETLEVFFNEIKTLMDFEESFERSTVESCAKAILHIGHHLQHQVTKFFLEWKPTFDISTDLRTKIEDFMGTRGNKHMQISIKVSNSNQRGKNRRGGFRGGGRRGRGGRRPPRSRNDK